jgi:hypothetical protein
MYTLGRLPVLRGLGVWFYQKRNPALSRSIRSTDLQPIAVPDAVQILRRDGAYTQLRLQDETVAELLDYCRHSNCYGDGDRSRPFRIGNKAEAEKQYGTKFALGRYMDCREDCAAVRRLERDPTLLALARGYLGCEPVLVGARMWWSFANPTTADQQTRSGQTYHFDIDGYRSVSFFFYLTDVDEGTGPHVFVRGSHRKKLWRHLCSWHKSRSDAEIQSIYPASDIRTVCGQAGQGIAEDTFCFHKGSRPRSRDRLLFQVRFGLRKYGTESDE